MALSFQHLFTNSPSPRIFKTHATLLAPVFSPRLISITPLHFQSFILKPPNSFTSLLVTHNSPFPEYESDALLEQNPISTDFNLDSLLSIAEFFSLAFSVLVSVAFALNGAFPGSKSIFGWGLGNGAFAWGVVALAGGVAIGAWIRRRQWRRVSTQTVRGGGRESVNLLERIEKLEEDIRSSATIIRVLSRQLEKLGIRFRVTRKSLKDPIAETAALAQKNSEATRAIAAQEHILEKELRELQKVLLAMQEQQGKQLELILAIAKTTKLWDKNKEGAVQENDTIKKSDSTMAGKQMESHSIQASARTI